MSQITVANVADAGLTHIGRRGSCSGSRRSGRSGRYVFLINSSPAVASMLCFAVLKARLLTYLPSVGDTGEFNPLEKKKKKKKKTPAAELVRPALVPSPAVD